MLLNCLYLNFLPFEWNCYRFSNFVLNNIRVSLQPDALTPLHKAAKEDYADIVKCLLKHGGDALALTKVNVLRVKIDLTLSILFCCSFRMDSLPWIWPSKKILN